MIERVRDVVFGPAGSVVSAGADGAARRAAPRRLLLLLTGILALDFADRASLGALGPDIKQSFGLGNAGFGLLGSAFGVVGGLATIPAGILTDRARRTLVLGASILLWSAAMAVTGAATSLAMLLGARVFLGAVTATARPAIASITGDVFGRGTRGRALGLIDSGELLGNGAGFLVAAAVAAVLSWRAVFWTLAAVGVGTAVAALRLPEPPRSADRKSSRRPPDRRRDAARADPELVLHGDQRSLPLWRAMGYVLRIRTNVIVIVAVALTSLFFSAVRIFGVVFITRSYGVGRSTADLCLLAVGVGGLVGMLAGGRIGDALVRRGRPNGRLVVASYSYVVAALCFVPTLFTHDLIYGIPAGVVAAAALIAPTAPLDAVRLDVVHPQLWGRAEATRNVLQIASDAAAPLGFGLLADHLAGGGVAGMRTAYLIALALLVVSAVALQAARRWYPTDAASAAAADR